MGSFRGERGGNRGVCVQGRVYWGKVCAKCARHGFRGFPELFVLPHSRAPAGTRTVGLVRHGTCLRRVQGCCIGESVNLDTLGLEITVHESRVTSVHKRMEPRRSLLGASVDQTEARYRCVVITDVCRHRAPPALLSATAKTATCRCRVAGDFRGNRQEQVPSATSRVAAHWRR